MAITLVLDKETSAELKRLQDFKGFTTDEAKAWVVKMTRARVRALINYEEKKASSGGNKKIAAKSGKPSKKVAEKVAAKASSKKAAAKAEKVAPKTKTKTKTKTEAKAEAKVASKKLLQDNTKAAKKAKKAAVEVEADDDISFD